MKRFAGPVVIATLIRGSGWGVHKLLPMCVRVWEHIKLEGKDGSENRNLKYPYVYLLFLVYKTIITSKEIMVIKFGAGEVTSSRTGYVIDFKPIKYTYKKMYILSNHSLKC